MNANTGPPPPVNAGPPSPPLTLDPLSPRQCKAIHFAAGRPLYIIRYYTIIPLNATEKLVEMRKAPKCHLFSIEERK